MTIEEQYNRMLESSLKQVDELRESIMQNSIGRNTSKDDAIKKALALKAIGIHLCDTLRESCMKIDFMMRECMGYAKENKLLKEQLNNIKKD